MRFIDNDFKTIQFAVFFSDYDDRKKSVYRFLLPKLLTSHTKDFPFKQEMHEKLEHLYGAYFKLRTERYGNINTVSMVLTIVNPKIANDPTLLNEAIQLIKNAIFNRTYFSKEIFEEEKRLLIEQWLTLKDKKRLYAHAKFHEHFFKKDLYGYPLSGKLKDIKQMTLEDLETYYHEDFMNNHIDIYVNGHLDLTEKAHIERELSFSKYRVLNVETSFKPMVKETLVFEKTTMNQALIKLGYVLPIYRRDPLYDAAVLFDIILGGYPDSMLFQEIREKRGLCYDVSSNYDGYKGVLLISSGVDVSKKEDAIDAIKTLIHDVSYDTITEAMLSYAKAFYVHQLKSSLDSQSTLTKRAYVRDLMHFQDSIEVRIQSIESVTLEDVMYVKSKISLNTTYVLHGGDRHDA